MTRENYKNLYDSLIQYRKYCLIITDKHNPDYVYHEDHHIVPRSLGGTDDYDNMVSLYAYEHFLAHKLLMYIYAGTEHEIKMAYAFCAMCNLRKKTSFNPYMTAHKYQKDREFAVKILSKNLRHRIRLNKNGKMKYAKPEDVEFYLKMGYEFGMVKHTEEWKRKVSKTLTGRKRPNTKPHSKECYEKISQKLKGKQKHILGRIRITDGINETFIKKDDTIPDGWYRGRSNAFKKRMQQKRGKRTPEQRHNISRGHLGQISHAKGKIMITDGVHNTFIESSAIIPKGWHRGGKSFKRKVPVKPTTLGRMWITNGIVSRFLKPGEEIPYGWKPGRVVFKK